MFGLLLFRDEQTLMAYLLLQPLTAKLRRGNGCRSFLISDMLADSNNSQHYFYLRRCPRKSFKL